MSLLLRRAILLSVSMLLASFASIALTPKLAVKPPEFSLENIIPERFGDWQMDNQANQSVVNPQTQAFLQTLYSQTLSRVFVNPKGRRIMLSLAYGADQNHDNQIHKPEVCYPAQGFQIIRKYNVMIRAGNLELPAMRVETQSGGRYEPVTYWIRMGDTLVRGAIEQNLARVRAGLNGKITDGMLFRISEVNSETQNSYALQDQFIAELLTSLTPEARQLLIGNL
jgi:EpsI family protein